MDTSSLLRTVLSYVAIVVAAYYLGYYFTALFQHSSYVLGGFWSVISGIIVNSDVSSVMRSAKLRTIGSLIGAAVSGVYLHFFDFSVPGFAACIAAGAIICRVLKLTNHIKLTGVTIAVIMLVSVNSHNNAPLENAALRFFESVIGAAVAVAVTYGANALPLKRASG